MRRVIACLLWATACRPTAASDAPGDATPTTPAPREVDPAHGASSAGPDDAPEAPPAHATTTTTTTTTTTPPTRSPTPSPTKPATPTPTTPPAGVAAFDRGAWPHWIDADGDCQDTRTEVLVAESEIAVTFTDARQCEVRSGRWRCPYTDRTITDPRELDVDHLVPLAHAHAAGAAAWDRARREAFANALDDPDHLVAVLARSNRSKGARSVEAWLPEEPGFRCEYVAAWRRIKHTWALRESETEREAIDAALRRCAARDVPERPGTAPPKPATEPDAPATPTAGCCRVCKSGKACGDACIAADKTCRKPPGCAC